MAINFPTSPTTGDTYTYLNSIYQWDGTHWSKIGGVTGQVLAIQTFTANGTYTPTTGMEYCVIECVGSGAGGGGVALSSGQAQGGGGGGGGYSRKLASAATIGASQTVTVSLAGTGGTAGNNAGSAGGDVSVGSLCIGKGGSSGSGAPANSQGTGGAGGVAGTGDFTVPGEIGWEGTYATTAFGNPSIAHGGSSGLGLGHGGRGAMVGTGGSATLYGGGGGGGGSIAGSGAAAGGNGSRGVVIITEYSRSSPLPGVASSTDNAVVRFDGTTGRCQDSAFVVGDTGHVTSFGGNITFPASQASSAGANVLDDYEEGTFTPVLTSDGTPPTVGAYANRSGTYTKIGRQVFQSFAFQVITSYSAGTGSIYISGGPFTAAAGLAGGYNGSCGWEGLDVPTTTGGHTNIQLPPGASNMRYIVMVDNGVSILIPTSGLSVSDYLYGNLTYEV